MNLAQAGTALLDAGVAPDDPRLELIDRALLATIEAQVDRHLAELGEIAPPGPGFDRRREQKRFDRLSRALDSWIEVRTSAIALATATAGWRLDRASAQAQAATLAFDLELQELLNA